MMEIQIKQQLINTQSQFSQRSDGIDLTKQKSLKQSDLKKTIRMILSYAGHSLGFNLPIIRTIKFLKSIEKRLEYVQ